MPDKDVEVVRRSLNSWAKQAEAALARIEARLAAERELVEALEKARAAIWDAHYGKGLSAEYAREVDLEIDTALGRHALAQARAASKEEAQS